MVPNADPDPVLLEPVLANAENGLALLPELLLLFKLANGDSVAGVADDEGENGLLAFVLDPKPDCPNTDPLGAPALVFAD